MDSGVALTTCHGRAAYSIANWRCEGTLCPSFRALPDSSETPYYGHGNLKNSPNGPSGAPRGRLAGTGPFIAGYPAPGAGHGGDDG